MQVVRSDVVHPSSPEESGADVRMRMLLSTLADAAHHIHAQIPAIDPTGADDGIGYSIQWGEVDTCSKDMPPQPFDVENSIMTLGTELNLAHHKVGLLVSVVKQLQSSTVQLQDDLVSVQVRLLLLRFVGFD